MPSLRLVAGSALLALVVTGCGSQSPSAGASKKSSDSPSPSSSGSTTPGAAPSTQARKTVQTLRDRVQHTGAGTFGIVTRTVAGKLQASIRGRYDLSDQQLSAHLVVPQKGSGPATAEVAMVKDAAYFQVAEWDKRTRSCWLRTTPEGLSQDYGLDVASNDDVPVPVGLLDAFQATTVNGKGLVDGSVDISAVLPLLSGSNKRQIVAAQPTGQVPAFLSFNGRGLTITVPGYALSTALGQSLGLDPSRLSSIADQRFATGVKFKSSVAVVRAPARGKQMSAADLKANRCG
jgi:hypothetical protein